jgi:hypothetical protein
MPLLVLSPTKWTMHNRICDVHIAGDNTGNGEEYELSYRNAASRPK